MVHGTGSKDTDNVFLRVGWIANHYRWVCQSYCWFTTPAIFHPKHFSGMNDTPSRMM